MKILTKTLILLILTLTPALPVRAGEPARTERLDLASQKLGPAVELVEGADGPQLRIDNATTGRDPVLLFDIIAPVITKNSYALVGEVRYEGVEGEGFLETWNHFPAEPGGRDIAASYFSRTLGDSGPMGKIRGDSDWRPFSLPFFMNKDDDLLPLKITWNLALEGPGLVELRNIRLIDGIPGNLYSPSNGWWSSRTSGILGGILGLLFGVWGSAARYCAAKGNFPAFARSSFIAWLSIGTSVGVAGIIAISLGQPYHVTLLFLFFGILLAAVGASELVTLNKRETRRELLRMRAADL